MTSFVKMPPNRPNGVCPKPMCLDHLLWEAASWPGPCLPVCRDGSGARLI